MTTEPSQEQLYQVAHSQQGFFTSKQALECGYSTQNQNYHVKAGHWEQQLRGIFRLKFYPRTRPYGHIDGLILSSLWSVNRAGVPQGVISHQMALMHYGYSTWPARQVHMTVPKGFRRNSKFNGILYFAELREEDITSKPGFRITKPLRTIVDCLLVSSPPRRHIVEAIEDALRTGGILPSHIKKAILTPREQELFLDLLASIEYEDIDEVQEHFRLQSSSRAAAS
ncbi:MAG: hypothetical protein K2X81_05710 [Candidatus Obscuribacterales bacterium]|nr:hypothetical protein [Candidatus Obscuribacterales bacterium]